MKYPRGLNLGSEKSRDISTFKFADTYFFRCKNVPEKWVSCDDVPMFHQIQSQQSMNLGFLSCSWWVRFDDKMMYHEDYAVIGISKSIFLQKILETSDSTLRTEADKRNKIVEFVHKPISVNYSHCELVFSDEINKSKAARRAIRLELIKSKIACLPPNFEVGSLRRHLGVFSQALRLIYFLALCRIRNEKSNV